ncbi:Retrovirus-related Pol polyprotein from transposon TNT 1-94 [Abeliophyllum distichum]|uniref:Retrovirus-related Pol polyprotein from transposon TNT 1-94 n=1 Tax=Abeliophyllum distichum TaxID=126358 RepID=A0ABD1SVQ4_9LAMI
MIVRRNCSSLENKTLERVRYCRGEKIQYLCKESYPSTAHASFNLIGSFKVAVAHINTTLLSFSWTFRNRRTRIDPPVIQEGKNNRASLIAFDAWKHSDFLCKNYILNGLDNTLYNVYCSKQSAKDLWESLERKYKIEDAGTKKFIVKKFLDYKMVDSKMVISHVQELQIILHDIHAENMSLSESFQVATIIEKLPPMWRDFKNYLKHKRKEMNIEELVVRLKIEEDNRSSDRRVGNSIPQSKANVVESNNNKGKKREHYVALQRRMQRSSRATATIVKRLDIAPLIVANQRSKPKRT